MQESAPSELADLALELLKEAMVEHSSTASEGSCPGCWKERMANDLWRFVMSGSAEFHESADRISPDMKPVLRQPIVPRVALANFVHHTETQQQQPSEVLSFEAHSQLAYLRNRLKERHSRVSYKTA